MHHHAHDRETEWQNVRWTLCHVQSKCTRETMGDLCMNLWLCETIGKPESIFTFAGPWSQSFSRMSGAALHQKFSRGSNGLELCGWQPLILMHSTWNLARSLDLYLCNLLDRRIYSLFMLGTQQSEQVRPLGKQLWLGSNMFVPYIASGNHDQFWQAWKWTWPLARWCCYTLYE